MERDGSHKVVEGPGGWIPAAMAICGLLMLLSFQLIPSNNASSLVVVFAPGTTFEEATSHVAEAGGFVIDGGAFSNVLITEFEEGWSWQELKTKKVWLVLSALGASSCLSNRTSKNSFGKQA